MLFHTVGISQSQFNIKPFERKVFIENKGQFAEYKESYDELDQNRLQFIIDKDYKIGFYPNKIAYLFADIKTYSKHDPEGKGKPKEERRKVTQQLIEVEWLNANPNPTIITASSTTAQYTYSGKNKDNKSFFYNCKGFEKITYKNLYDNIDVVYTFHPQDGFKYSLILHPGADINAVQLNYKGAIPVLKNKTITIPTINGIIQEQAPLTYYSKKQQNIIDSKYILNGSKLSFKLGEYDRNKTIVVDPIIVVPANANPAYDNGVDDNGNIYVYGGTKVVEKYDPAGTLIWSLTPGIDRAYYGDLLVEGSGNFYLCEGFVIAGAKTYKYDPTSSLIWQSTFNGQFREHWRLAINCVTQKVIVAGGGTTNPTLNIAEIDINNGTLINAKTVYNASQSDVAGLAVDQTGKAYLIHSNPNILTFTDNANNTLANVNDGYGFSEIGISSSSYYPSNSANGYNMMVVSGQFLFTTDGAVLKKWDINTQALISSVTIPGPPRLSSGILADNCDNLFVGSNAGIYRFDFNLNQLEFQATPAPVFDIAFSTTNADIIACGNGFLSNIPMGRVMCATATKTVTIDSCETTNNSITVTPQIGLPPFSFLWNDGNTSPSRNNLSPGTYTLTIKDNACPPSFIFDTIIIPPKLFIGDFTNDTVCLNSPTQFNGTIAQTPGSNTWNWDFGDGNTSTVQNPTHTYSSSGTYTTVLIIENDQGCSDTVTKDVIVYDNPIASFIYTDTCHNANSVFTNNSTINLPDVITNYTWDFGDQQNSTQENPTHLYTNHNTYNVKLTITSDKGCKDSLIQTTTIFPNPIADFSVTSGCIDSTHFTDNSSIPNGTIDTWQWDFNDGGQSNSQHPAHFYSTINQNFAPTLIVTSNHGCKDTTTGTTVRYPFPQINFTYTPDCFYDTIIFNNTTTIETPGSITSWVWNFGDGTALNTNQHPNHLYQQDGTYTVTLIASSTNGCVKDSSMLIEVYPKPVANFSNTTVCENFDLTTFTDLSTVSSGSVSSFEWDFAYANNTSAVPNPTFNYDTAGVYNVSLIVTTNYNCKDTIVIPVTVHPKPIADMLANVTEGCSPICVDFTDNSTTPSNSGLTNWNWDFNNGENSTEASPSSCFINNSNTNDQTFTISLIVGNDLGCYDTIINTDLITSWYNPIASFIPSPEETNMYEAEITTTNTSIGANSYYWNFDNTTTATDFEPVINYSDTGSYNIMLAVATSNGCVDTTYHPVIINPVISLYIPNTFTPNGDGDNDLFIYKGYGIDEKNTQFYIFDRWGTLIYYTENSNPWDGTYKGELVQQDTYIYKLVCKDVFGEQHEYKGHVNLIR